MQNNLPIILIFELEYHIEIKVYHVYQDILTFKLSKNLEIQCETENPID